MELVKYYFWIALIKVCTFILSCLSQEVYVTTFADNSEPVLWHLKGLSAVRKQASDQADNRRRKREFCVNETTIMETILNESVYNKHRLPNPTGVDVKVGFWIQEISSISEITSDFEMDMYINELWVDNGLAYWNLHPCKNNITLGSTVLNKLWVPNTCFVNSKFANIHNSPFKNVFLMIYPNGTVWVNYRVKVKGPCEMDLTKFPMDTQKCSLIYESFNYNMDEVRVSWEDGPNPVWTLKNITLPDYELVHIDAQYDEVDYPAGKWIELTATFTFQRRYVWYFLQAYIPTYLTIFLSWVSFTLGVRAIPARTMLGVNSLLALMFQFGTIMKNLPRVSYVKAIDVWMLACMTFIFASLLELAAIGHLVKEVRVEKRKQSCMNSRKSTSARDNSYYGAEPSRQNCEEMEPLTTTMTGRTRRGGPHHILVERYSPLIPPLAISERFTDPVTFASQKRVSPHTHQKPAYEKYRDQIRSQCQPRGSERPGPVIHIAIYRGNGCFLLR